MSEQVKVETMDGVGLLTFSGSDPRNVLTAAMWRSLKDAVRQLEGDASVRVLVLTGAGHVAFATDPAEPDPAYQRESQPQGDDSTADGDTDAARGACAAVRDCRKPVMARLRGECIGGGLAVALCADIRIAAADTAFAITGARAAALDAERLLVETVGAPHARFLLLTGERIETDEALRIGLVTRVVPDADLSDMVADLARQFADADDGELSATKQAIAKILGR